MAEMTYITFADAAKRADALRRALGVWPGIVTMRDSQRAVTGYRLTFDPQGPVGGQAAMYRGVL